MYKIRTTWKERFPRILQEVGENREISSITIYHATIDFAINLAKIIHKNEYITEVKLFLDGSYPLPSYLEVLFSDIRQRIGITLKRNEDAHGSSVDSLCEIAADVVSSGIHDGRLVFDEDGKTIDGELVPCEISQRLSSLL